MLQIQKVTYCIKFRDDNTRCVLNLIVLLQGNSGLYPSFSIEQHLVWIFVPILIVELFAILHFCTFQPELDVLSRRRVARQAKSHGSQSQSFLLHF